MTTSQTDRPALFEHTISPGGAFSILLRANRLLTLRAEAANACASTFLFGVGPLAADRLNLPDTLKAQHRAAISAPMVLMSDLGLGMASVVDSSLAWHDALSGHTTDDDLTRFPETTYQQDRNGRHLSARHGVLSELRKHGRGEADLHGCVNFFSKVATSSDDVGTLAFALDHSRAGDWVTLRSEVDLLVVIAASCHPLDPRPQWSPSPITVAVAATDPWDTVDPSYTYRPESARALDATRRVFA